MIMNFYHNCQSDDTNVCLHASQGIKGKKQEGNEGGVLDHETDA